MKVYDCNICDKLERMGKKGIIATTGHLNFPLSFHSEEYKGVKGMLSHESYITKM